MLKCRSEPINQPQSRVEIFAQKDSVLSLQFLACKYVRLSIKWVMNISNQFTRKKGLNQPWLSLVEKSYFKHIAVSAVYTTKFSKNTQPLKQFSTYYSQKLHNDSSIISCEKSTENDNQSHRRHMFDLR